MTYGQLVSHVQRTALKICQDDKIQKQLAKEKATSNKELGTFCEQFGFPACKKSRPSKPKHKQFRQHKPAYHKPRKPFRKTPREHNKPKEDFPKTKLTCFRCGKQGHISKYCRFSKKLNKIRNIDESVLEQINNLLIDTSESETETENTSDDLNNIQEDDLAGSSSSINVITKEQDLLFDIITKLPDDEQGEYLFKLKELFNSSSSKPKTPLPINKYDLTETINRFKHSVKPTTLQNIQHEIHNLKAEVSYLRTHQET